VGARRATIKTIEAVEAAAERDIEGRRREGKRSGINLHCSG
jgi:hypothetical protein